MVVEGKDELARCRRKDFPLVLTGAASLEAFGLGPGVGSDSSMG